MNDGGTLHKSPGNAQDEKGKPTLKLESALLEILACPRCHAALRAADDAEELRCTSAECGLIYPVRDDIPVLLVDQARHPGTQRPNATGAD